MDCAWGYTWYGRYLHHNWIGWFILLCLLIAAGIFLFYLAKKTGNRKCPNCRGKVEETYLRCPECGHALKSHCPHCNRIVETTWQFCPHCKESLVDDMAGLEQRGADSPG